MNLLKSSLVLAVLASAAQAVQAAATAPGLVGGYLLIDDQGAQKLKALADNAATLPLNRIWISFVRPDLVYVAGSNTLETVGLGYPTSASDYGFAEIKGYVSTLQKAGVEVFLSMGGWSYSCFPYPYLANSIAPYGGDNAGIIAQYGGGNINNCNESNLFCYACDPPSNGDTMASYAVFPEPSNSALWQQAQSYVQAGAPKKTPPVWHPDIYGGQSFTDPWSKRTVTVPGWNSFFTQKRDPYEDLVLLATDLGVAGVDIDYEEFWHADTFKTGDAKCDKPCHLYQTVYKYSAIIKDIILSIQKHQPSLKVSTAASAAGAWSTDWWGGNLKGIWYYANQYYPDIIKFMSTGANAGGINIMSYDLSTSEASQECPAPGVCSLQQQVAFYMGTYDTAKIPANVGYEIGTPAYPTDPQYMANLTTSAAPSMIQAFHPKYSGGFYWELFKTPDSSDNIDVTSLSQDLCKALIPGSSRCSGTVPGVPVGPPPATSTTKAVSTTKATSKTTSTTTTTTTTPAKTTGKTTKTTGKSKTTKKTKTTKTKTTTKATKKGKKTKTN
ncbi:uncharacterized protein BJ171DRAFT_596667 [Polychytrium aggregatum]|uniref:uncharacterized protein n=1 Tax=Polychytrium aggregatum TaxID=110093 RepID=UPI0022FF1FB3|nr:uncharacterized protein BJ171DRAFT_596667 [Polychytrium aggregatum]KAI9207672.1 hypothetical protein BJ171DRAFT_596667 [Polychytrium aggregatum]